MNLIFRNHDFIDLASHTNNKRINFLLNNAQRYIWCVSRYDRHKKFPNLGKSMKKIFHCCRCFARDMNPKSIDKDCKISLVGEDEEAMILKYLAMNDGSGTPAIDQVISNSEPYSDLTKKLPSPKLCFSPPKVRAEFQPFSPSVPETMSRREGENPTMSSQRLLCDLMQKIPLQLSEEKVAAITGGFMTKIRTNRQENSETYTGFVPDDQSQVMVKRFKGDSGGGVLEAEKKAALCMCHTNILGLKGYYSSEDTTVLVFPFPTGRTLEDYLYGKS